MAAPDGANGVNSSGRLIARPLLGLVWLYRTGLSPLLGANCRFEPSCSAYADQALREYGGFKGGWLVLKRIARCHPWGGSGYDPLPQREPDAEQLDADLTRGRTKALNHAYGFISRGNRAGGLQHLYRWIENEIDIDAAYRWFFEQMLKWESTDAALFLAQTYLSRLLSQQRDVEALKLMSRCLLEDARFQPLAKDGDAALAAAERQGNDDLIKHLKK